jgi:hypothetical protein
MLAGRCSRGGRILGTETIAVGSAVRLPQRALHRWHRSADTEGFFGVLGDPVGSSMRWRDLHPFA